MKYKIKILGSNLGLILGSVLLLCIILTPIQASISRYAALSQPCLTTSKLIEAAIDLYESEKPIITGLGVTHMQPELLIPLVQENYIKDLDKLYKELKDVGCDLYLMRPNEKAYVTLICTTHGIHRYRNQNLSPKEQFVLYCTENNMNPNDYNLELSTEPYSDIKGSKTIQMIGDYWGWLFTILVILALCLVRFGAKQSFIANVYLFCTIMIAVIIILSSIIVYYTNLPVVFAHRLDSRNYPQGIKSLNALISLVLPIWWFVSLIYTIVAALKMKPFFLSLVYSLLMPFFLILIESHLIFSFPIIAKIFPFVGIILIAVAFNTQRSQ